MAYQAKYWNGSAWVAVANASFDTSGLVKTTGNTGTVDLSGATVVKGAGMDLIVPTSVTGGTFSASGAISFSASTEIDVDGCFSAAYDNYLLSIRYSSSGNAYLTQRLRASGSNVATSTYAWTLGQVSTSAVSPETGSASATSISATYSGTGRNCGLETRFFSPFLADQTLTINDSSSFGSLIYRYIGNGLNTNTISYNGIALIPSTGTITGTLRIYGYHN